MADEKGETDVLSFGLNRLPMRSRLERSISVSVSHTTLFSTHQTPELDD